jgi:hypothetical protein
VLKPTLQSLSSELYQNRVKVNELEHSLVECKQEIERLKKELEQGQDITKRFTQRALESCDNLCEQASLWNRTAHAIPALVKEIEQLKERLKASK